MTPDPDPRNELGNLPPEYAARCVEVGVVWARLHDRPRRRPLLITSAVPTAVIACDALATAHQAWLADSAGIACKIADGLNGAAGGEAPAAALTHDIAPLKSVLE